MLRRGHNVQEQILVHSKTTVNTCSSTLDLNTNPAAAIASHEPSNSFHNVTNFLRQTSDDIFHARAHGNKTTHL